MRVVGILGAGLMGTDIALLFANAGYEVILRDVRREALDKAKVRNKRGIEELRAEGLLKDERAYEKITYTLDVSDMSDVFFVLEAVTEDLKIKHRVLKELERIISKETVIATNTSSYTVSELSEVLKCPKRFCGMHFSNPPIQMPLIEVVAGKYTSSRTIDIVIKLSKDIGKTPILIKKDCRGFVLNRLILNAQVEGLWSLVRGYKAEDIDSSIRALGVPYGPIEGTDLVGIDTVYKILKNFIEVYGDRFKFPENLLKEKIERGELGKKTGRGFYKWMGNKVIRKEGGYFDVSLIISVVVNEAFRLLEEDVASKEDIDAVFKAAFNTEISIFGLAESIGYSTILSVLEEAYKKYELEMYKPCKLLIKKASDFKQ